MKFDNKNIDLSILYKAFASLQNESEIESFLYDICTETELIAMAQRILVAKMLTEKENYSTIVEKTRASSTTVSRVSRFLNKDGAGGYKMVLERLSDEDV
ncbi:MAG: transcriptional regulator [Clostridia bacterium]|nr:transcriptional regulator [Clostridia bacterium]